MAGSHSRAARVGGHVHEIRRNVIESRVLLVANLALVAGTGALLAQLVLADLAATLITAGVFLAGGVIAFLITIGGLTWRIDARPPDAALDRVGRLLAGMAIAAGIRTPRLYLIDTPKPNALAFGLRPNRAAVAVTTGLLRTLTPDEVEAVLAHEVAHIANRDTAVLTVAYGSFAFLNFLATAFAVVAIAAAVGGNAAEEADADSSWVVVAGAIALVAFVLLLLVAPSAVATWLVTMAISRNREALADATAVRYLGSPTPLRTALEKLVGAPDLDVPDGIAAMCIHARGKHGSARSTHPPLGWRIDVLRALEGLPPTTSAPTYADADPVTTPWGNWIPVLGLALVVGLVVVVIDARTDDRPGNPGPRPAECEEYAVARATAPVDPVLTPDTLTDGVCFTGGDGAEHAVAQFEPEGVVRLVLLEWDPDAPGPSGRPTGAWTTVLPDVDWERVGQSTGLDPPQLRRLARALARED